MGGHGADEEWGYLREGRERGEKPIQHGHVRSKLLNLLKRRQHQY